MARIVKTIEIEGRPAVALFDTGALYSYVRSSLGYGNLQCPRLRMLMDQISEKAQARGLTPEILESLLNAN